ncbi:MAG: ABC transporter permease [Candidatus Kinetoplastibacterium crithidii]|nr:ABC transporter permease [Candidatus Kinetoplastibacterium crithidii]
MKNTQFEIVTKIINSKKSGFITLMYKELLRFYKVFFQTVAAPVTTAILYLLVFSQVMGDKIAYNAIPYTHFIIPGLMMMSMLQNAFSNPSSSLVQSRMTGSIIFMLMSPISPIETFFAYIIAAVARGLLVGVSVWIVSLMLFPIFPSNILWVITFSIIACGIMGSLGIIAGLYSEKYDQLSVFQNFLIVPSTFLSGVFYSIHNLPKFWQQVSLYNPVFYVIDGFRFGFFDKSDVSPWQSLIITVFVLFMLAFYALYLLSIGYKIRN